MNLKNRLARAEERAATAIPAPQPQPSRSYPTLGAFAQALIRGEIPEEEYELHPNPFRWRLFQLCCIFGDTRDRKRKGDYRTDEAYADHLSSLRKNELPELGDEEFERLTGWAREHWHELHAQIK